ncbi:MAG: hypothetical protein QOE90_2086 [Thermoplasmata archaeon]|jgi:hypothetical protein|nr:hypothetical protein [Thermoplasmata archaeon]
MKALTFSACLLAVALAGCTLDTQQSTAPPSGGSERTFPVDVPAGTTQLRVDTTATTQSGDPDVTVLVKDAAGNILGAHTWAVKDRTGDILTVDVHGQAQLIVAARAIDGDASLDVRVSAILPSHPEVAVVHETLVITQTQVVTTPASSTPAPSTPASSTPAPTPTPPTNATNSTTNNTTAP